MKFLEVTEAGNIIANSFEPILFKTANNMFRSSEMNWASYQMVEIILLTLQFSISISNVISFRVECANLIFAST